MRLKFTFGQLSVVKQVTAFPKPLLNLHNQCPEHIQLLPLQARLALEPPAFNRPSNRSVLRRKSEPFLWKETASIDTSAKRCAS